MTTFFYIIGSIAVLFFAYAFFSKQGKCMNKIVGRLLDAAKAHDISTSSALKPLLIKLSVKTFSDFVRHKLKYDSLAESPVLLQIALLDALSLRVTALCHGLALPPEDVVPLVARGVYGPAFDKAQIGRWTIDDMLKSFTKKNSQQLYATSNDNRGFLVLSTLELMAAPLENAIPGSATARSATVLQQLLELNVEELQSAA